MILIIDNYDSFTYNIAQYVGALGGELKVIRDDAFTLSEIRKMDFEKIILSPGPGRPENAGVCVDVIKEFYSSKPILGVCLGHQAIGIAFGGEIDSCVDLFHGKTSRVFHQASGLFRNMSNPFTACRYHSLTVAGPVPSPLKVTAYTEEDNIMAIEHEEFPVYGVQFHPESILTHDGFKLIENFLAS